MCVSVTLDPNNCGDCGVACGAATCSGGACVCFAGTVECGTGCVDLASAVTDCGACGNACPAGQLCSLGRCTTTCDAGLANCGGSCVDTTSSASHCGACGNACPSGQLCAGSTCGCPGTQTLCGAACIELAQDPANCGSCGNQCAAGASCVGGTCQGGGTGGAAGTGGQGTGGAGGSGGTSTGGAPTGGVATGGAATGGAATGGAATGGAATGGAATGGAATGGAATGGAATGGLPPLHVQGNTIRDARGNTVILRGVSMIDVGAVEEWDGGWRPMVDRLTNPTDASGSSPGWATRVIRVPVYPHDSADFDSPNTYQPGSDTFYTELLRPLVDYCADKGVYVIIDWHYIDTTTNHQSTTDQFWAYMAPRFANDAHVLFELYNEPINDGSWPSVRADMQSWYDTVRESAPNNLVLVGTPNWSQIVGPTATNPISGTNVVYTAHMYPMHWADTSLRQQIQTAVAAHPVFITEWGFEQYSNEVVDGTITSYGAPFKAFVDQQGVSFTAWVASYNWFPAMYANNNWQLAVGEGRMGGFAKDWLWEKRNSNQPQP